MYSPRVVHDLLGRYGLRPTKSLGQNFLIDGNVLRLIVEAGGAAPGTDVYEVGPGLGVLTRELARSGARVTTLEKDERLRPVLEETLAGTDVRVIFGDALEFDWSSAPAGSLLIANLPYYISTAILTRVMRSGRFARATFLVQREVGERLIARPGGENYGFLSALVGFYGHAEIVRDVPKGAFYPAPDVTSAIVRLHLSGPGPEEGVLEVLEAALAHRRKTLRNNLIMAGYAAARVDTALRELELSPTVRGEALSLDQLVELARQLRNTP
nr:16S rRNA (adenine(1518)-N(6)/adenine(1519)-N(6))-dimethyltransferase RsmA [Deinobacterium chartae]